MEYVFIVLLVTTDEKVRTVQIGVKQLQSQEVATDWGSVIYRCYGYRYSNIDFTIFRAKAITTRINQRCN